MFLAITLDHLGAAGLKERLGLVEQTGFLHAFAKELEVARARTTPVVSLSISRKSGATWYCAISCPTRGTFRPAIASE